MLPVLQIGPIAVQAPGLFIILGLWLGLSLAEKLAPRFKFDPTFLYNLVFISMVAGVLGARLSYVLQNIEIFLITPLNLISLNTGLLDINGGIAVGIIAALIYCNRNNLPLWSTLDALTPFFIVTAIFISLSQFASGDAFGMETQLPWGISLWGVKRHPTQVYYALAYTLILGLLWYKGIRSDNWNGKPGITFLVFTAATSGIHLFLEAFRGDSVIWIYNIRSAQIAAWFCLALSLWGALKRQLFLEANEDRVPSDVNPTKIP